MLHSHLVVIFLTRLRRKNFLMPASGCQVPMPRCTSAICTTVLAGQPMMQSIPTTQQWVSSGLPATSRRVFTTPLTMVGRVATHTSVRQTSHLRSYLPYQWTMLHVRSWKVRLISSVAICIGTLSVASAQYLILTSLCHWLT